MADSISGKTGANIGFDVVFQTTLGVNWYHRNKVVVNGDKPRIDTLGDDVVLLWNIISSSF